MIFRRLCAMVFALMGTSAYAADAPQLSSPLTTAESQQFVSLVCDTAIHTGTSFHCGKALLYPDAEAAIKPTLWFTSILYGEFIKGEGDEAYVTYRSNMEPGALDNGGGILFRKQEGAWHLVRWYPGGQMEHCLKFPSKDDVRLLCLNHPQDHGNARYTSLSINTVPASNDVQAIKASSKLVLTAEDMRRSALNPNYQCTLPRQGEEAILLSITSLDAVTVKSDQEDFAFAKVLYATPEKIDLFCKNKRFAKVPAQEDMVRISVDGSGITIHSEHPFAKADY